MFLRKINNKKQLLSWSLYDFANQPFTTIIVTFIYSTFFVKVIVGDEQLGTALWANAIAISSFVVALFSPIIGVISDSRGYRKFFLTFFTLIASIFSILLFFPKSGDIYLALSLFIIANISFEIGSVLCNSYLLGISDLKNRGIISGFAWGLGFIGGLIALFLSFLLFPDLNSLDIRRINILVGVWFLLFSLPSIFLLKDKKRSRFKFKYIIESFCAIRDTFHSVSKYKLIIRFLIARLFYNDALITIFALGGVYAVGTLDFSMQEVMVLGIVLNISAGVGAFSFGYLEDKIGVVKVINISLVVLILSTLLAYLAPFTSFGKDLFWVAGIFLGLMIGPNQSCSRSLMASLTPSDKQSEFFGFFALTGKATSFLGPLLFSFITIQYNQQDALWVVIILFLIGLILFNRIRFN